MVRKIKKFEYCSGKFIKLIVKEPFVSMANGLSIKVDEYFDRFSLDEQRAIIWHELYHHKYNGRRLPILWLKTLFKKEGYNVSQLLEFEADEYSVRNNGKEASLRALNKIRKLMNKKIIPQSYKDHPKIDERIRRIQELK